MQDSRTANPLVVFLALVVLFSIALTAVIVAVGANALLIIVLMWSVGISAIAALKLTGRPLSELGWSLGHAKHHLIAFALPIAYAAVAYGTAAAFGLVTFPDAAKLAAFVQAGNPLSLPGSLGFFAALLLFTVTGMIVSLISALGEEIGWRGFLAPRLVAAQGFVVGTLLTGLLWALWHMPLIVLSGYNGGGDIRLEIPSFVVGVVAMSGAMSWLRLSSGSLWPCATFHASHNLFVQGFFDRLTTQGASKVTMVGEFGVLFATCVVLASLPFWRMGMRSPAVAASALKRARSAA